MVKPFTLGAALALLATKAVAEYRPKEHLVLLDCGFSANGDSRSRHFLYYPDEPWGDSMGTVLKGPELWSDVPWDGSYPWRSSGLQVDTSNGDTFHIWIDPAVKDWAEPPYAYAGSAVHKYEGHKFDCYGWHKRNAYHLNDGTECGVAYICYHDKDASGGGGDNIVYERESTLTLNSDTIKVEGQSSVSASNSDLGLITPQEAFHKVWGAIEGNRCKSPSIAISSLCDITFDCTFGGKEGHLEERSNALAAYLDGVAGPEIAKSENAWTTYSNNWGVPTYHKSYSYPRDGKLIVSVWLKGHPEGASPQSEIGFTVTCRSGSWFCSKSCGDLTTGMLALGYKAGLAPLGVFGTILGGGCGRNC